MEQREPIPQINFRPMTPEVRRFSSTTRRTIGLTADYIGDSWEGRQSSKPEMMALRHALISDERCLAMLEGPFAAVITSLPERYDLQAGCLVLHHVIPFTLEERRSLMQATGSWDESPDVWNERAIEYHKKLAEKWVHWLGSRRPEDQPSSVYSEPALLEEACKRLTETLGRVLGHSLRDG